MFCIGNRHTEIRSTEKKNERISAFLLLLQQCEQKYAKEHDRFESFQQFRIFLHCGDDCKR